MDTDKQRCEPFTDTRDKIIVRTSTVGIATNVLLAAFKTAVGLASHSIAVVLDAVNNLSDALSSIITIVGTKLSGKLPDQSVRSGNLHFPASQGQDSFRRPPDILSVTVVFSV